MARKVFISFLGTNNYVECIYDIDGHLSKPVKYVQEALVSEICKDWKGSDRIFVFCTKDATEKKLDQRRLGGQINVQKRHRGKSVY